MRIGILSDTHDHLSRTRRAVEILLAEGADILIHCGDLTSPDIVAVCAVRPFYFVFGNHDADQAPELRAAAAQTGSVCLEWGGIVELEGKRVGVAHGHMTVDVRRVIADRPDYLLTGHSHDKHDRMNGPIRRINPGALFRADEFTVAVLDLPEGELRFLNVE
ncbi:metallophosphoesterase family protein [Zavarzinella formosa]|uniref:metallophosphoesterase family protein n=1 Tax=Zavarzinella formosa TaxID=360055 RepID=UPI00030EBF9C|nr:metallophosphoesterase family protein [Zavarzinella formosa]